MSITRLVRATNRRFPNLKNRLPKSLRKLLSVRYSNHFSSHRHASYKNELLYLDALRCAPLNMNEVLYESFYGKSIGCSPRAIFEVLLADPAQTGLRHVWAVTNKQIIPAHLTNHPMLRFVISGSIEYAQMLATAGYIVTNSTLPTYFMRREGQIYVNTWHGVPLKKMFKYESAEHFTVHSNSARNFLHASHILLPNTFAAHALLESADVLEAVEGRVVSTGAPRVDETLTADRSVLRAELGVPEEVKIIFVAPTYRGALGKAEIAAPMLDRLLTCLNQLDSNRYVIFAQMHYFVGAGITGVRTLPAGMATNRFMAAVDILISDYSSIMFDFMATGRQVILYVYDRFEYEEMRGLYVPLDDLPVQICMRPHEVVAAIDAASVSEVLSQYTAARARFFPLEDGHAAARAAAAMFVPTAPLAHKRPRLLFYAGGWKNNGITSSILNLLRALVEYDVDIYVVTEGRPLENQPDRAANLRRVHPRVRLIHRTGNMLRDADEDAKLDAFYAANRFTDTTHEAQVRAIFAREARRIFGDLEFDVAIDFSGYARFWSLLLGAVQARRHVIYQHNDLLSEAQQRFDVLFGVFSCYKWYDTLVSVSDGVRQINLDNLRQYYPSQDCAVTVCNMIDAAGILDKAKSDVPRTLSLPEGRPWFVTAGRLSPEKSQGRAIRALGKLHKEGSNAHLIIMGSGPLQEELKSEAEVAGVADYVIFTGQVDNPFPIIAAGDCFLLTSDYEGQGMVLLEALTLGKPVISTDNPATRSVLGDGSGYLVPLTDEGVADGMRRFLVGEIQAGHLDTEVYCSTAIGDFFDKVLGVRPLFLESK